jgi:hypothetical protein
MTESLSIAPPSEGGVLHRDSRWPARRTLNNLAWGLGAVGLGWLAQGLLVGEQPWAALLLYVVAVSLFVARLRGRLRQDDQPAVPGAR